MKHLDKILVDCKRQLNKKVILYWTSKTRKLEYILCIQWSWHCHVNLTLFPIKQANDVLIFECDLISWRKHLRSMMMTITFHFVRVRTKLSRTHTYKFYQKIFYQVLILTANTLSPSVIPICVWSSSLIHSSHWWAFVHHSTKPAIAIWMIGICSKWPSSSTLSVMYHSVTIYIIVSLAT